MIVYKYYLFLEKNHFIHWSGLLLFNLFFYAEGGIRKVHFLQPVITQQNTAYLQVR